MNTFQQTLWAAAAAFCLFSGLTAAHPANAADSTTGIRKALQADYAERDSAVGRKDIGKTLAHYAPEFVGVGAAGKTHNLSEERADFLKTFALPAKSSSSTSTIQKLTVGKAGTEAVVTLGRHGVLLFANPQTKQNDVLILDGVFQDTWAKHGGDWVLTKEQTQSVQATMNGKPLKPN